MAMNQSFKRKETRVAFRISRSGRSREVTAVLPDEPSNISRLTVYGHTGQHGEASRMWYYRCTRPAKPEQYANLLAELTDVYAPVPLRVVKRIQK